MAVAITYNTSSAGAQSGTSFTINSVAIGTASADRVVVIGLVWYTSAGDGVLPTVTIGGIAATRAVSNLAANGGDEIGAGLYYATVPTGTTANVDVAKTGNNFVRAGIGCWSVTGDSGSIYHTASQTGTSASPSVTINKAANGGTIAISVSQGSAAQGSITSWSGVTADYTAGVAGFTAHGGGSTTYSGATAGATVQASWNNAQTGEVVAAISFQPAAAAASTAPRRTLLGVGI